MKVLIVGSGGREHAIAWKVAQSLCRFTAHREMPVSQSMQNVGVPITAMEFDVGCITENSV